MPSKEIDKLEKFQKYHDEGLSDIPSIEDQKEALKEKAKELFS